MDKKEKPLIRAGIYQHYKGNLYRVIGIATHSETLDKMVVYRAQKESFGLWVRPLKMFMEDVKEKKKKVPRFKFIKE